MLAKTIDECARTEEAQWHKIIDRLDDLKDGDFSLIEEGHQCRLWEGITENDINAIMLKNKFSSSSSTLAQHEAQLDFTPLPDGTDQIIHNKWTASLVSTKSD